MRPLALRLFLLALLGGLLVAMAYLEGPTWTASVTEASAGQIVEINADRGLSVSEKPATQSTAVPLPPTIRPASPVNPAQIATIAPAPVVPGGIPPGAQPQATPPGPVIVPPAGLPPAPAGAQPAATVGAVPVLPPGVVTVGPVPQTQPGVPTVGAGPGGQPGLPPAPGGTVGPGLGGQLPLPSPPAGTVGAGPRTGTPAPEAAPPRTISGTVTNKTERSIEIQVGDRGTITVEPRPQTEIRRDGVKTTLDSIEIGDTTTISINEENFPLAIIATSPQETTGANPLWYVLLGVVMLGVTLMLDSELRRKFMAALLEP